MNKYLVIRMNKRLEKTQIKANKHRKIYLNLLNKTIIKRTKFFLFELKSE